MNASDVAKRDQTDQIKTLEQLMSRALVAGLANCTRSDRTIHGYQVHIIDRNLVNQGSGSYLRGVPEPVVHSGLVAHLHEKRLLGEMAEEYGNRDWRDAAVRVFDVFVSGSGRGFSIGGSGLFDAMATGSSTIDVDGSYWPWCYVPQWGQHFLFDNEVTDVTKAKRFVGTDIGFSCLGAGEVAGVVDISGDEPELWVPWLVGTGWEPNPASCTRSLFHVPTQWLPNDVKMRMDLAAARAVRTAP